MGFGFKTGAAGGALTAVGADTESLEKEVAVLDTAGAGFGFGAAAAVTVPFFTKVVHPLAGEKFVEPLKKTLNLVEGLESASPSKQNPKHEACVSAMLLASARVTVALCKSLPACKYPAVVRFSQILLLLLVSNGFLVTVCLTCVLVFVVRFK